MNDHSMRDVMDYARRESERVARECGLTDEEIARIITPDVFDVFVNLGEALDAQATVIRETRKGKHEAR